MKSFNQILERVKDLFKSDGVPSHSVGGSKHSNKNRKANPWRRAHKPLYGGMAHRLDPIGQVPAWTIQDIRDIETILSCKCVLMHGQNLIAHHGHGSNDRVTYIGGPNQTVKEAVMSFLEQNNAVLAIHEKAVFQRSRARKHDISFTVISAEDQPLREYQEYIGYIPKQQELPDDLNYEIWYEENYDALSEEFSESGAAEELDSDLESFIEDRYEATVRGVV